MTDYDKLEEQRQMTRSNYYAQMAMMGYDSGGNALDLVEVVRCKDCRFAKVENNYGFDEVICYNEEFGPRCPVPLDWFCADGERRDGE